MHAGKAQVHGSFTAEKSAGSGGRLNAELSLLNSQRPRSCIIICVCMGTAGQSRVATEVLPESHVSAENHICAELTQ